MTGHLIWLWNLLTANRWTSLLKGQAKRDKLSLFHQICDAVSFCHRSFIVHGDLKPSNIMVSSGRIKILDLGVSQRISETDNISSNAFGATREFASPEVLDGSSPMIASDVFALGKILDLVFPNSQTNQELKAIISKSLEINPKDRYQSVEALSADLRALSTGHPISAIPNSRYYRSAKFFQRNPLLSASVFVTIISLGAGLVFSTWQYNQAQKQATRAQAVTSFVTNLFERAHPDSGGSEAVTLRQIMDDAASRADTELSSTTDVLLDVKSLIASGYYGLGEYDKSLQINEDIYTALSKQADPDTLDYVEALNRLGSSYTAVGQPDAAIPLHQEASDRLNESGMEQSRAMAGTLSRLSEALWAKDDQLALETKIKSLEVTQLSYPKNHHMIARRLAEVGNKYRNIGEHDKAIKFREDALEIASKSGLKHDPFFIGILCNTALDYGSTGHHAKAVEMLKRCLNMRIDRLGADHSENIATQNNIGAYAIALGNVDDAQNVLGDAYTRAQTALPEAAVSRLAVEINYAISLWHSGKAENAQPIIQSVLTRMEGAFGMESPPAKRARAILARLALENGDLQRAKALSKQSFGGLTPVWNADANLWAAEIALADGDLNAAAEYAKTAFSERQTVKDFTDWQIAEAQWIYGLATSNENAIKTAKETLQNLPKHHLRHPNNLPAGFTPVGIK